MHIVCLALVLCVGSGVVCVAGFPQMLPSDDAEHMLAFCLRSSLMNLLVMLIGW